MQKPMARALNFYPDSIKPMSDSKNSEPAIETSNNSSFKDPEAFSLKHPANSQMLKKEVLESSLKQISKHSKNTENSHVRSNSRHRKNMMKDYVNDYSVKTIESSNRVVAAHQKSNENTQQLYYQKNKNTQAYSQHEVLYSHVDSANSTENLSGHTQFRNKRHMNRHNSLEYKIDVSHASVAQSARPGYSFHTSNKPNLSKHSKVKVLDMYQLSTRNAKFSHPNKAFKVVPEMPHCSTARHNYQNKSK